MKISVVARNSATLFKWLNDVCRVNGRKMARRVDKVRVWHDDILPLKADRGDERTVFEVCLDDDCQDHIVDFLFTPKLAENNQYLVSRNMEFLEGVPVYV
jgi:hypothetical protein